MKKKISLIVVIFAFGVLSIILAWGVMSGDQEKWLHYQGAQAIAEYSSFDRCNEEMKKHSAPSGCRRIDGPYKLLNDISDLVF